MTEAQINEVMRLAGVMATARVRRYAYATGHAANETREGIEVKVGKVGRRFAGLPGELEMSPQPTPEQIAAIEAFAARHGRFWKRELIAGWWSVNYPCGAESALLQQVRNNFGPTWLINYRRAK